MEVLLVCGSQMKMTWSKYAGLGKTRMSTRRTSRPNPPARVASFASAAPYVLRVKSSRGPYCDSDSIPVDPASPGRGRPETLFTPATHQGRTVLRLGTNWGTITADKTVIFIPVLGRQGKIVLFAPSPGVLRGAVGS